MAETGAIVWNSEDLCFLSTAGSSDRSARQMVATGTSGAEFTMPKFSVG